MCLLRDGLSGFSPARSSFTFTRFFATVDASTAVLQSLMRSRVRLMAASMARSISTVASALASGDMWIHSSSGGKSGYSLLHRRSVSREIFICTDVRFRLPPFSCSRTSASRIVAML